VLSSLSKGLLAKLQEGLDFKLQMREPLQQVSGTLPESERVMTVIWFDIVVFAAVAAFLAYRLYSVLGEKNDNEREQPNPFVLPPRDAAETPPPASSPTPGYGEPVATPPKTPSHAPDSLAGRIASIHEADPAFSEKSFLSGARSAFEMIVTAFAAEDTVALRPLLSDDVYSSFSGAIRARQLAKEKLETKVVRIKDVELMDAVMTINTARVTVRIVSEQIQCTRNAAGDVVDGNPTASHQVTDVWSFARNTRSLDPNWHLVETRAEG
jgi:predicted lipid-binding transport protein (Tim44 family)